MWAIAVLVGMVSLTGFVAVSHQIRHPISNTASSGDLAINMRVYRLAVVNFVRTNPNVNGVIPDASLQFPPWYAKNPLWTNHVAGGMITVYPTRLPPQAMTMDIVAMSGNSIYAGEADTASGRLFSPVYGQTQIPLPLPTVAIPNGAPVWMARVN